MRLTVKWRIALAWLVSLSLALIVALDAILGLSAYVMQRFGQHSTASELPALAFVALLVMCIVMVDGVKGQIELSKKLQDEKAKNATNNEASEGDDAVEDGKGESRTDDSPLERVLAGQDSH